MVKSELPGPQGEWSAAAIVAATGGRLLRSGRRALRLHTDSRDLRRGDCFVALHGDQFDGHDFVPRALRAGAAGLIVDRPLATLDVPRDTFVVQVADTGEAFLQLAAAHRSKLEDVRIVGITGSCGKTSTKDLLGSVLAGRMPSIVSPRSFNNQVGVPLTLLQLDESHRAAVVEIGTNAPGEILALTEVVRPQIGIVTCVAEAHLAGLGSLADVATEKASIFDAVAPDGVAILNIDDAACRDMAKKVRQRVVTVSLRPGADWFATDLSFCGFGTSFRLNGETRVTIGRVGSHNVYNALMALAAAVELGVDRDVAIASLTDAVESARRLQPKKLGEVIALDDTYNMNPGSARAALDALAGLEVAGRRVAVFGEMLELGDESDRLHRELGAHAHAVGVDLLMTVGAGAAPIAAGARAAGLPRDAVLEEEGRGAAERRLLDLLAPGDTVLFKASRRVELDRLVDALARGLAAGTEIPRPVNRSAAAQGVS